MTGSRRELGKTRLPAWTAGFVTLTCVAILALSGWREWESRQLDLHDAEVEMANLARSLTQHADDSFELTDTILVGLVDRLETDGTGPAAIEKIQKFLQLRKSTGRIHGIFVYNETGRWLATTEKVDLTDLNNSDRDYFQRHRASPDRGTLIGHPVKSRSGGQWIITASRRFNHPDGSFAGVALTTIDASYFSGFYQHFDVGPNGTVSLLSADGTMLVRSRDNDTYVGRDMSNWPLFAEQRNRPAASVYYFKSPFDGVQRLSFYMRSERYPIMVLATRAKDEVLEGWRAEALARMAFVLGLTLIIAVFGCFLVRQLHRGQRMAAALAATEADFRLLAEYCSDMVVRMGLDWRIRYVSPSCAGVLGWTSDDITGMGALEGMNPEDVPRAQQTLTALSLGEAEEARITYRNRHRLKKEVWIEAALRVTRSPETGEIDGVVAICRDMTEQMDLHDRLAALATSDGLTGLANRRQFDERLQDEWARAKRDGTPLSLLLIDVDHFKKFNDQYGHQAGDACLRSIAQVFAGEARRPADLAARYGGEEFVLLLPKTDAEDCERIGKRVRQSVHDLAMPHVLNPPSERVTVSLGGATDLPAGGAADHTSLIEAADLALYSAKDGGRDRLIMSAQVIAWPKAKSA
jgi:diguanylate cyclase (GGDEF)-like protein/PAS domain S-box-containing protein